MLLFFLISATCKWSTNDCDTVLFLEHCRQETAYVDTVVNGRDAKIKTWRSDYDTFMVSIENWHEVAKGKTIVTKDYTNCRIIDTVIDTLRLPYIVFETKSGVFVGVWGIPKMIGEDITYNKMEDVKFDVYPLPKGYAK